MQVVYFPLHMDQDVMAQVRDFRESAVTSFLLYCETLLTKWTDHSLGM